VNLERELEELLTAAQIEERLIAPLARYGAMVLDSTRQFNLTGAKSAAEFAPHLLDSLTVVPYIEGTLVDVGSGAGLPAIPIAIATGVPLTLVETTVKKARFLAGALEALGLQGEVVAERAEVAAHDPRLRGQFRSGTARAVATAPTVAELLLPFIAPGGVAILQRGTLDERERAALADASLVLGGRLEEEIPLDGERRIMLVRKTDATQGRFPRRTGVPEKRPLCF
jgi:16S rRNA (guanine527-N7)-methyltransferase